MATRVQILDECCILVYMHINIHNIWRCKQKHNDEYNIRTSINERIHFFIKIYTSHTLFAKGLRKGWCWLCVRGELETRIDCYILTQSSSDHSSTSSSFCWAAQLWVTEGPSLLSGGGSHSEDLLSLTATGTDSNCDCNFNFNWLKLTNCFELTHPSRL